MKKFMTKTLILLVFSFQSLLAFDYDAFTQYVEKSLKEWGIAGAAITVVENGDVKYIKCFGVQTQGQNKPITTNTQFMIASLTKAFTSLLVLKLSQEGTIDLNKPVQFYLPTFNLHNPSVAQRFKISDLLSHNSGLPQFAFDTLGETGWSEDEIISVIDQIPSKADLREKHDYQNIFPGIAGIILQKITHKPLSVLYTQEIFTPLGFQDTTIGKDGLTGGESLWARLKAKIKAWFTPKVGQHYLKDGQAFPIDGGNPALYRFPSTRGINSSISDMAKWLQFWQTNKDIHGNTFLSPQSLEELFKIRSSAGAPRSDTLFPTQRVTHVDYGLGWYLHDYASLPNIYTHMGGMTGNRSLIVMVPEKRIGMVVLCNVGGMRVNLLPEALRSKFLDMILDLEPNRDWSQELLKDMNRYREQRTQIRTEERRKNPLPAHELDTYVGDYNNKLYGNLQITKEGEAGHQKLVLHYRHLSTPLSHWNGDNFTFDPSKFTASYSSTDFAEITFGHDQSGKASVLMVNLLNEGEDSLFYRVK